MAHSGPWLAMAHGLPTRAHGVPWSAMNAWSAMATWVTWSAMATWVPWSAMAARVSRSTVDARTAGSAVGPGTGTALEATCPGSRSLEASRAPTPAGRACWEGGGGG